MQLKLLSLGSEGNATRFWVTVHWTGFFYIYYTKLVLKKQSLDKLNDGDSVFAGILCFQALYHPGAAALTVFWFYWTISIITAQEYRFRCILRSTMLHIHVHVSTWVTGHRFNLYNLWQNSLVSVLFVFVQISLLSGRIFLVSSKISLGTAVETSVRLILWPGSLAWKSSLMRGLVLLATLRCRAWKQ